MTRWNATTAHRYASIGTQAHLDVIGRRLDALLGPLAGRRVLDFGCGPGWLTRRILAAGAHSVVGLDQSPAIIEDARRAIDPAEVHDPHRLRFDIGDERHLPHTVPYDAAICCLVLMMCETKQRLDAVLAAIVGSLRPGGTLGVVVTHPCFRTTSYRTFRYRMPANYTYWDAGRNYEVIIEHDPAEGAADSADQQAVIVDHHWPLNTYMNAISEAGATVRQVFEWPAEFAEGDAPIGEPAYLAIRAERGATVPPI